MQVGDPRGCSCQLLGKEVSQLQSMITSLEGEPKARANNLLKRGLHCKRELALTVNEINQWQVATFGEAFTSKPLPVGGEPLGLGLGLGILSPSGIKGSPRTQSLAITSPNGTPLPNLVSQLMNINGVSALRGQQQQQQYQQTWTPVVANGGGETASTTGAVSPREQTEITCMEQRTKTLLGSGIQQ